MGLPLIYRTELQGNRPMNGLPNLSDISLALFAAFLNAILLFLVERLLDARRKSDKGNSKRVGKVEIVLATDNEVRRYAKDRQIPDKEKKQVAEYLKYDVAERIRKLSQAVDKFRTNTSNKKSDVQVAAVASGVLNGYAIYASFVAHWPHTLLVVIIGSVVYLLAQTAPIIPVLLRVRQIDKEMERIQAEIRDSLLLIGPKLSIEINVLVEQINDRHLKLSPIEFKELLETFGFQIPKADIMRAYFIALYPAPEQQARFFDDMFRNNPEIMKGKQYEQLTDEERSMLIEYASLYLQKDATMDVTRPGSK